MAPNDPDHLPFLHRHRQKVVARLHDTIGHKWAERVVSFGLFWELVFKGFLSNRCPARATALAYTTLLALIPMLIVAASVTTAALKSQGREQIDKAVEYMVGQIIPKLEDGSTEGGTNITAEAISTQGDLGTNQVLLTETAASGGTNRFNLSPEAKRVAADTLQDNQQVIVDYINDVLHKVESGTLGVTGMIGLIVVAILLFSTIETTFNDIWGVPRGRSWVARVVQYWATVTLGPLIPFAVLSLGVGSRLEVDGFWFSSFVSKTLVPLAILSLGFSFFYQLMPNTRVRWSAALLGGFAAGVLWHLNSYLGFLFLQKSEGFASLYGSLAIIPLFLFALYISWLILLFGAQVAYAYQNRVAYLQEKEAQQINFLGREYMALRIMVLLSQNFLDPNTPPPSMIQISERLRVSTRLVKDILDAMADYGLVMETGGEQPGYTLAQPATSITCHSILMAIRTHGGDVALTSSNYAKEAVDDLFYRVLEAEKSISTSETLDDLTRRVAANEMPNEVTHPGATSFLQAK